MIIPKPLKYPKGIKQEVKTTESFTGLDGRVFKLWPENHKYFYWTIEFDKQLKQKVNVLKVGLKVGEQE